MKKLILGILAHVDAGKTTLSESMLYLSGKTERLGRVDKQDAYLDTHELEKARGITIFSSEASFEIYETLITLLDTPGHVDFSAEMERTLQVLDYAILVISGADGVQGHTSTLWRLLDLYQVPVFLFINKMDQPGTDELLLLQELKEQLDYRCIKLEPEITGHTLEELALCDERLMETYFEKGKIGLNQIQNAILQRKVFPCFFGSALKLDGVESFLQGLVQYTKMPIYPSEFGARIYKISRDAQGNRLTHLKLTGGNLQVKDLLTDGKWQEKVNEIRLYSGEKYEVVGEIHAGAVCAVTGLNHTKPGQGLGYEEDSPAPTLEPVLSYRILLPDDYDPRVMLPKLQELEEEQPELRIVWDEPLQEIQAQIMGEVQIEILQSLILRRFGVEVELDAGRILYKETISNLVEGVGHFEPLRHYAEVHLLLEPGVPGSGLEFAIDCSEDILAKNWQRLVLSHLKEKSHLGVLTGSPITDLKITLVSGRAHKTHTEGGDFREATYRAVRQGLKEAKSVLLEPYYSFRLEVPGKQVGWAMTDIEKMHGSWEIKETTNQGTVLVGNAPAVNMRNYHQEVIAYTKGLGRFSLSFDGYKPCHNPQEVIAAIGYDSERDAENPTGSVFCSQGTGFYVKWDEVKNHMHVESVLPEKRGETAPLHNQNLNYRTSPDYDDEDYKYLNTTSNQGKRVGWNRRKVAPQQENKEISSVSVVKEPREKYLLVDGYNVIHAWPELKELADENMDGARMKLLDTLSSYKGIKNCEIIVVFDAYRVQGRHLENVIDYHNIHVVFTKEAQTADEYIEKFAHDHRKKYDITVATSDALQQVIIRGSGSALLSARELKEEVETSLEFAQKSYHPAQGRSRTSVREGLSLTEKTQLEGLHKQENSK